MARENRVLRFILPLFGVGGLAALILFLPLVPQSGLHERLTIALTEVLQNPCQIRDVRLQILPRPGLKVNDLTCSGSEFSLKINTLDLVFSPLSLLSFSPQINDFQLHGVLAEVPFNYCIAELAGDAAPGRFFSELLENINPDRALLPATLSIDDGVCKLTGVPGCKSPLLFAKIAGDWQIQTQKQSENIVLTGELDDGLCSLEVTRYKIAATPVPDSVGLDKEDSGNRLEINCRLQGISRLEADGLALEAFEHSWQADFENCDLQVDINGNPDGGLRFTGKLAALDHHLWRSEKDYSAVGLWSQGVVKANFSGFFQDRDGYLNIKNLFIEYPDTATLSSRGLVRFREPIFVNLVNQIKVDDLAQMTTNCPLLGLPGYQFAGRLESDLKLVGNPFSAPVLKMDLNSEKIVLQAKTLDSEALQPLLPAEDIDRLEVLPEKTQEALIKGETDAALVSKKWYHVAEDVVRRLLGWQWVVKSDCRIGLLELPGLNLSEVSFMAEKNLVQLEVERLSARFGDEGKVRLSLILDDFLQEPRWQASLVVDKLDLKAFRESLGMLGVLDFSMVGGGRLGFRYERHKELDVKGKWRLRQGVFSKQPLFVSFAHFLEREGGQLRGSGFTDFSGSFAWRDKILRLDDCKINFPSNRLQARGRFFVDSNALDFNSQFSDEEKFLLPFYLTGTLEDPKFTAQ